jgi:hypothetical protein
MDSRAAAKWKFLIRKAFFSDFGIPQVSGAGPKGFLAYSSRTWQWLVCQRFRRSGIPANAGCQLILQGFPAPGRLINGRHAV